MRPEGDRVLGVVGTFVLDRIVGLPERPGPVEDLGGIAYALAGVGAALPPGWRARPVARVGRDAHGAIVDWLTSVGLSAEGLVQVDEPNNRVELLYHDADRRTERLSGGVSAWRAEELLGRVEDCDALLVNFISGMELTLDGAERLRGGFSGPIYSDFHSLLLGVDADGTRVPRPLPARDRWLACFDAIQLNEVELDLLRGDLDRDDLARSALAAGACLVACTRGREGAVCWASPRVTVRFAVGQDGARQSAVDEHGRRGALGAVRAGADDAGTIRSQIDTRAVDGGDPTGCGDVWGAVMCCRLLAGDDVQRAGSCANRVAAEAALTSGTRGLAERLVGACGDNRIEHEREDS